MVASALSQITSVFPKFVTDLANIVWKYDKQTLRPITATGIVGLNVGKNKETQDEVEVITFTVENQSVRPFFLHYSQLTASLSLSFKIIFTKDYLKVIRSLGNYADYIVVNISSPNTPGLRDTFQRKERLQELLFSCMRERDALISTNGEDSKKKTPLLVKISPDLSLEEMVELAELLLTINNRNQNNQNVNTSRIDGLVISNTTTSKDSLSSPLSSSIGSGGISGRPLFRRSVECIRTMYALTDGTLPIIGVGGVGSGHDAYEMIRAGASVIELYTVLTYEGPGAVSQIRNELIHLLYTDGHKSVQDAIGCDHETIYWRKKKEQLLESS
jgi:dihydroorotate dehydrogenase